MGMYLLLKSIFTLLIVMGLIALAAIGFSHVMRKRSLFFMSKNGNRSYQCDIVDVKYLDNKRKLVLVKSSRYVYILLLGNNHETLIDKVEVNDDIIIPEMEQQNI